MTLIIASFIVGSVAGLGISFLAHSSEKEALETQVTSLIGQRDNAVEVAAHVTSVNARVEEENSELILENYILDNRLEELEEAIEDSGGFITIKVEPSDTSMRIGEWKNFTVTITSYGYETGYEQGCGFNYAMGFNLGYRWHGTQPEDLFVIQKDEALTLTLELRFYEPSEGEGTGQFTLKLYCYNPTRWSNTVTIEVTP